MFALDAEEILICMPKETTIPNGDVVVSSDVYPDMPKFKSVDGSMSIGLNKTQLESLQKQYIYNPDYYKSVPFSKELIETKFDKLLFHNPSYVETPADQQFYSKSIKFPTTDEIVAAQPMIGPTTIKFDVIKKASVKDVIINFQIGDEEEPVVMSRLGLIRYEK